MKRSIILMIVAVLFFTSQGVCQSASLQDSISSLSSSYIPGVPFTVTIGYSVSGAVNPKIVCSLPSTVNYVTGSGGTYDASSNTVTFSLGSSVEPVSSQVSFNAEFPAGADCSTGNFTATISADNVSGSVVSNTVTAGTAVPINPDWFINPSGEYLYSLLSSPNLQNSTSSSPAIMPIYYDNTTSCGGTSCNNPDSIWLPIVISNSGTSDIQNAYVQVDFNGAGVTIIDASQDFYGGTAAAIKQASPYQFYVGDATNTLEAVQPNGYTYYVRIAVPSALFGSTTIHATVTVSGDKPCGGGSYNGAGLDEYFQVIPTPSGNLCEAYPLTGCTPGSEYYIHNWNECQSCSVPLDRLGLTVTAPSDVQLDMISLPSGMTGTDSVWVTGHYHCGITGATLPFVAPSVYTTANDDELSPAGLIPGAGCSADSIYITDYTFTSNINSQATQVNPDGDLQFSSNYYTPNAAAVAAGINSFEFYYNVTTSNGFSCSDSLAAYNSTYTNIYSNNVVCNQQECFNIGDTVNFSLNLQNSGNENFSNGKLRYPLPQGLQYVPGSATYSIYPSTTSSYSSDLCDVSGTSTSSISLDPAATSIIPLWDLPAIDYNCNSNGDVYNVKFKAFVTNTAIFGTKQDTIEILDAANNLSVPGGSPYNSISICKLEPSFSPVKQVSIDGKNWTNDTTILETAKGAALDYRITIDNNGTVPLGSILLIDMLPTIGDSRVINCDSLRGSNTFITLTSPLRVIASPGANIQYDTSDNPSRATFLYFTHPNTSCETGSWFGITPLTNIQTLHAFKIDFGDSTLDPGDSAVYEYSAEVPPGTPNNKIAYNSFGATAIVKDGTNSRLIGAESLPVSVQIDSATCQCIGDFVWLDSNQNGQFDAGEQGMNGVSLQVFDANADTAVGLPHISSPNFNTDSGYYEFCGLPPGSYFIQVTAPAGYQVGPAAASPNPSNHNDANPATGRTSVFTITCGNPENDTINIGIVPATPPCNQGCIGRQPLQYKNLGL
jgi:uncharacterized repeat protein (TIGR01451 family)